MSLQPWQEVVALEHDRATDRATLQERPSYGAALNLQRTNRKIAAKSEEARGLISVVRQQQQFQNRTAD